VLLFRVTLCWPGMPRKRLAARGLGQWRSNAGRRKISAAGELRLSPDGGDTYADGRPLVAVLGGWLVLSPVGHAARPLVVALSNTRARADTCSVSGCDANSTTIANVKNLSGDLS